MVYPDSVSRSYVIQQVGLDYRCPVCKSQSVSDAEMDWGLEPVTSQIICFGCVCDLSTCVTSPDFDHHPFKRELSALAIKARISLADARVVWLKHLKQSIAAAIEAHQAGPSAAVDLRLINRLLLSL